MFQAPIKASHRLFFALVPPIVQARQIAHAAPWFGEEGKPVAAERLHITMFILDDRFERPPAALIDALRAVGEAIAAAPIRVVLDRVGGGAHSIALRPGRKNAALDDLHGRIAARAAAQGIAERRDYAFSPHMTLGYRRGTPFNAAVAPVAWDARELVLIHSHLGKTRHERIGTWRFEADDAQGDLFG
ncbi:MAG: 2'-5' RNA ligase family protein [Sphingomonas sp.]